MGSVNVTVTSQNKNYEVPLIVPNSKYSFTSLLGTNWLDVILPNWRNRLNISHVKDQTMNERVTNSMSEFQNEYGSVFVENQSERIRGVIANLVLKESGTPVFHKAFPVPYSIREEAEEELKEMVKNKIIEPVKYSEWASPIVTVARKNCQKIRLCVDFKHTLNSALKTDHYPLPVFDDIQ